MFRSLSSWSRVSMVKADSRSFCAMKLPKVGVTAAPGGPAFPPAAMEFGFRAAEFGWRCSCGTSVERLGALEARFLVALGLGFAYPALSKPEHVVLNCCLSATSTWSCVGVPLHLHSSGGDALTQLSSPSGGTKAPCRDLRSRGCNNTCRLSAGLDTPGRVDGHHALRR